MCFMRYVLLKNTLVIYNNNIKLPFFSRLIFFTVQTVLKMFHLVKHELKRTSKAHNIYIIIFKIPKQMKTILVGVVNVSNALYVTNSCLQEPRISKFQAQKILLNWCPKKCFTLCVAFAVGLLEKLVCLTNHLVFSYLTKHDFEI